MSEADRQRAAQAATADTLRARQATMAPTTAPGNAPQAAASDPIVDAMRRKAERDREELRKAGLGGRTSSA